MTRFFLNRPVTLTMTMAACLLFGLLTVLRLDLAFAPDMNKPGLTILVRYPGTSSQKIDSLITKKVEEAVSRVPGVSQIYSVSSDGKSKVHVIYPYGTSLDIATMDILDALAPVGASFPRDVEKPVVLRYDPSDSPIFTMSISGKNLANFRRFAEKKLKTRFERVKGVSEVIVAGGQMKEVLVSVDRYNAAARNISLLSIVRGLQFANAEVPGGVIPGMTRELLTKTTGRFKNLRVINSVRVGGKEKAIFISDVADISKHGKPIENKSLSQGKEQVAIYVKKGGKASLVSVADKLRDVFEKTEFPQGAKGEIIYDASVFLLKAVNRLIEAGIFAALVASLVLFLFLKSFSTTAVVAMSIPLSISVTFTMIGLLDISLDVMTLSGLAVGAGMMVDNSIVVLESIHTAAESRTNYFEAAYEGTRRVGLAVFASTLTTACVFLPVIFLSARMRLLFGNLASAVAISLFASLFISLTAVPVLSAILLKRQNSVSNKKSKKYSLNGLNNFVKKITEKLSKIFHRILRLSLDKPLMPVLILCILSVLAMVVLPGMGQEILSPIEVSTLFLYVEFPPGTNLKHTSKITSEVSKIVRKYSFVKKTDSRIDKAHSVITIKLKKDNNGVASDRALDILTKRFKKYKKAFVHLTGGAAQAGGGKRSVSIDVTGEDLNAIKKWARRGAAVASRLPGIREVVLLFKDGNPELLIHVDKKKASLLGLTSRDVGLEVRSAIYGPIATKYIDNNREIDIRVRFKDGNKINPDHIGELPISVDQNKTLPLRSIANFSRSRGGGRIFRKNGKLTAGFSARFSGIDLGTAVSRIMNAIKKMSYPKGIRFDPGDDAEELKRSSNAGIFAVLLAILLVFMVLASLYESFKLPLIVIFSIPAAVSASILVLFITGTSLSVPVYLGLIMLAGLVVNNAIILVDDSKKLKAEGYTAMESARKAVERRLRPLMITTLTTVLGMLPLLLGGGEGTSLYKPLALTVLSGMSVSAGLSIFLIPALFKSLSK